jgi:hypothetical protein
MDRTRPTRITLLRNTYIQHTATAYRTNLHVLKAQRDLKTNQTFVPARK